MSPERSSGGAAALGSREWWLGAVLTLAAAGLYLGTLSRHYSSDSCLFAVQIASVAWPQMVAPHHLLLHPLGWIWLSLWQAFGWTGDAMLPLQALNALAGAACVGLFYWHCTRVSASTSASVAATSGFAVCGALWLLSTEAEFVTVPVAIELAVLGWILRLARATHIGDGRPVRAGADAEPAAAPSRGTIVALGIAIGVCVLAYASTAALLPAAILALCSGEKNRAPVRGVGLLLAGFAVPVLAGVVVALSALGFEWAVRAVLRSERGYGQFSAESLPRGVYAFLRTLVMFPGLGMGDRSTAWLRQATSAARFGFAITYVATGLTIVVPVLIAWRRRLRIDGGHVLALWVLLHVGFAFWWVPSDVSFWLPATFAWWLLVAVVAGAHNGVRVVAIAAAALLVINGLGLIVPQHRARAAGTTHPCAFIAEHGIAWLASPPD